MWWLNNNWEPINQVHNRCCFRTGLKYNLFQGESEILFFPGEESIWVALAFDNSPLCTTDTDFHLVWSVTNVFQSKPNSSLENRNFSFPLKYVVLWFLVREGWVPPPTFAENEPTWNVYLHAKWYFGVKSFSVYQSATCVFKKVFMIVPKAWKHFRRVWIRNWMALRFVKRWMTTCAFSCRVVLRPEVWLFLEDRVATLTCFRGCIRHFRDHH